MRKLKSDCKKKSRVVGFRVDGDLAESFELHRQALGVSESELARRAALAGFKTAVEEIFAERKKASAMLKTRMVRARGIEPLTPTLTRYWSEVQSLERAPSEIASDVLRHTAASYLLALLGDVGKVAMMLGNSPAVLMTHYHEPVTKENAAAFWKL